MDTPEDTIISQYAGSPKLRGIIETFNTIMDTVNFIDNFHDMIWNIETADTYGLDVWGKIVVVSRLLTVTPRDKFFGFVEANNTTPVMDDPQPFDQYPFYTGDQQNSTVSLTNDAYRKLIMLKAMANITDCTIPNINKMLMYMFGSSGKAYVRNDGGMVMTYVFEFQLSTVELAIVQSSGALPSPAGVTVNIEQRV
ncbi:TPA: DUF2612 domain-containing protein [Serratia marcescens]|uniref:DUF2612 domain-containing protein n=1 Tax=Serratia nevei TaxID=2703794 RepID=A0AAW6X444_9GAMM|nr:MULTISPECIES: DUF2612 domain-containing protein [Serratia]MDK4764984.1 DUF2612 domain-containing protein [Serratia nevei]MDK4796580.1 DUF2612 domain-containing protein [Serratia nevei]MDK4856866.1 DUF2612 domain-containing protein [Serratia nevei]MDK4936851.1 DUF2612 domain-containing protein [Serratia nevei]MDK5062881.1 DUF2612 domain-containing protein [Serratia nevei]